MASLINNTVGHLTVLIAGVAMLLSQNVAAADDPNPLKLLGIKATQGAAAGYVPDETCGTCHAQKAATYQHVGMAQSFAKVGEAKEIEDFGEVFYHTPSERYYQIRKQGDQLTFYRYQQDDKGQAINEIELSIDWVMGSGNRARSYLYQTPSGELYLLPLGWYTQGRKWGMSPGFEQANHPGIGRPVKRRCLFCHNAFPEVPEGSDAEWMPQHFPTTLPQGTGCQRCHGPGAEHIRTVLTPGSQLDEIRSNIVNPAKLEPERRDSVCFQCHMLPSITFVGERRFGRNDYSFRPGQHLSDYVTHVEIEDQQIAKEHQFEINHHGYRLWQSACFQQSKGELGCISCHDPHIKPQSQVFKAEVGQVCLGCHEALPPSNQHKQVSAEQCVDCHMPERRTRDVTLVTMTDHRIAKGPFDKHALTEPIKPTEPVLTGLDLLPWGEPPTGKEANLYRSVSVLRALPHQGAIQALSSYLSQEGHTSPTPHLVLLKNQLKLRKYTEAEETATGLIAANPNNAAAHGYLANAKLGLGELEDAVTQYRKALSLQDSTQNRYNLALALLLQDKKEQALQELEQTLEQAPYFASAWFYKGKVLEAMKQPDKARIAFIQTLNIKPNHTQAYLELVPLLRAAGKAELADRYLNVGLRVALAPDKLAPLKQ